MRSAHFTSSHALSSCAHVVCLILRDFSPFLFLLSIVSPIVLFIYLVFIFFFHDVVDKFLCTPANEDLGTLAEYDPLTKVRDENVETIQTLVGFAEKVRANTLATENLEQVTITRTPLALKITTMMTDMSESADAHQAHNDPVFFFVTTEMKLWTIMMRKTTRFLRMLLWMISLSPRQLNWMRLPYLPRDSDLDPDVSAQLEQASAQAYFSFELEDGEGKRKGRYPVRPSHLSLEGRRRQLKELKAKTECRALWSKGNMGHMISNVQCLPARLRKIRHVKIVCRHDNIFPTKRIRLCFVLNDCSDDPDTSAYVVGLIVPLPKEPAKQTSLSPTASAAVDIKNTATFNDHAMDDNDEISATEADHKTGWNKTFKSGTYRGMLYGIVLRDYPKQVKPLAKSTSVPANMRDFRSWAHRHYRIDVNGIHCRTQKQASWHLLVRASVDARIFLTKVLMRFSLE